MGGKWEGEKGILPLSKRLFRMPTMTDTSSRDRILGTSIQTVQYQPMEGGGRVMGGKGVREVR